MSSIYTRPFECNECGREFQTPEALNKHKRDCLQPELWSRSWFEDGLLGDPIIMCSCGTEVNEDHSECDERHEWFYRCPNCKKKIVVKYRVWVEFEDE